MAQRNQRGQAEMEHAFGLPQDAFTKPDAEDDELSNVPPRARRSNPAAMISGYEVAVGSIAPSGSKGLQGCKRITSSSARDLRGASWPTG